MSVKPRAVRTAVLLSPRTRLRNWIYASGDRLTTSASGSTAASRPPTPPGPRTASFTGANRPSSGPITPDEGRFAKNRGRTGRMCRELAAAPRRLVVGRDPSPDPRSAAPARRRVCDRRRSGHAPAAMVGRHPHRPRQRPGLRERRSCLRDAPVGRRLRSHGPRGVRRPAEIRAPPRMQGEDPPRTTLHGLPITTPERTLADLWPRVDATQQGHMLRNALRLKRLTIPSLTAHLDAVQGRQRPQSLTRRLARYEGLELARCRSDAEALAVVILADANVLGRRADPGTRRLRRA